MLKKDWSRFIKHDSIRAIPFAEFEDDQSKKQGSFTLTNILKHAGVGVKLGSNHGGSVQNLGRDSVSKKNKVQPDCWNATSGGKHYMKYCPNTLPIIELNYTIRRQKTERKEGTIGKQRVN